MKIKNSIKLLAAASVVAASFTGNSAFAGVEPPDTVELLSGSASLGAPVLSPRTEGGPTSLVYDGSVDATPFVVYPINVSGTITAKTGPTSSSRRGVTTISTAFSTYRITTSTLLGLIGANSTSRLVYVARADDGSAVDIDGNKGLFVCSSSNLVTGNLTLVQPYNTHTYTGVTIDLEAGYPLERFTQTMSGGNLTGLQVVAKIPVLFEADGYTANGTGSYTSTLAKGLRFSANLTSNSTFRLSGTTANFESLNDFSFASNDTEPFTETPSLTATIPAAGAFAGFTGNYSAVNKLSYSLRETNLSGATINSTTGNITFSATTPGNFTADVTATVLFNGSTTPVDKNATLQVQVTSINAPVVTVTGNLTSIGITQGQAYSNAFSATSNSEITTWLLDGLASKNGLSIINGTLSASPTATNWSGQITAINATGISTPVTVSVIVSRP